MSESGTKSYDNGNSIKNITDVDELKEVISDGELTVVDFYATWCAPCNMITAGYRKLAEKYKGVKFCKVNVVEAKEVAIMMKINKLPTFILFKDENEIHRITGPLLERVEKYIEENK